MRRVTVISFLIIVFTLSIFAQNNSDIDRGDREWTIVQSWEIPGKASGLAFDGTYLYFGIYGSNGDHVYQFDPNDGSSELLFTNPLIGDCFGMTYDGSSLWITNQASSSSMPAMATELNFDGDILSTFDLPDHYMSGIAYDEGDFWAGTYYPDPGTIYKLDNAGGIISQFTPPADQIWDICMQADELWMADYNSNILYKTDQSGVMIESHACENIKPSGIVFDGTYLWYVDGGLSSPSTLYKVDLSGAGTPEINIPQSSHNYGSVTIGESETWEMLVENVGDADLTITDILIPSAVAIFTDFTAPQTIAAGGSILVPLTYSPTETGLLDVTISVESSDPITPSTDVSLYGNAVNSGPSINIQTDSYNFYEVRENAFTRWFLDIENIGDETLIINEINSDNSFFIIDDNTSFPINITSLNSISLGVWFNPTSPETFNGQLSIVSNDEGNNPYTINLEGVGIYQNYPIGEVLWTFEINDAIDSSPKAIVPLSDITGDAVSELIISSEDDFIRCFNGNSSGIADVLWEVEISGGTTYDQPGLGTIEDINNDGFDDIIVGTAWGDKSVIAFSGKTGEQIWKHPTNEYGDGGWVYDIDIVYDYNDDGINDVLACAGDDGQDIGPKRVYCLNALDGISIWERPLGGPVFSVIGVEDFTGDGIADVIAGASTADETEGRVYGIDGSNGAIKWTKNTGGSSVWALVQLDDITGDGIKDVAAGDFGGNYYFIDPTNNEEIYHGTIGGSLLLRFDEIEDVNNDGYMDILLAHSKTFAVIINGFDGSFVWTKSLADKSWNVAAIDDLDGDEINDVIVGTLFSNNKCYFLNGINGEEFKSIDYPSPVDALNSMPDIAGDGSMEMVAGGRNGEIYCYSGGLGSIVGFHDNQNIGDSEFSNNYPNPFSQQTTINLKLENNSFVTILIYDINGKVVETLKNEYMLSGSHSVVWNTNTSTDKILPPGFYFYEVKTDMGRFRKKIVKL